MDKLKSRSLKIKNKLFVWGERTYLMGIINATPDSFSGDGLHSNENPIENALKKAADFSESEADIFDIGGESTRPGSETIEENEELDRVIPIIEIISKNFDNPISIDTYKPHVADEAIKAGASIINDVWGLNYDPEMAKISTIHNAPIILMHNRSNPRNAEFKNKLGGRYKASKYNNLIEDVKNDLEKSIELAKNAGIPDKNIIIDSGIGFGKSVEQNLELINKTDKIRQLGYPILIGPSRKSFIGYTLDLPPEERLEGTSAAVAVGITRNADIVRVHDVKQISRIVKMTDAIVRN